MGSRLRDSDGRVPMALQGVCIVGRAAAACLAIAAAILALAPTALADPPAHARAKALDVTGLNHACGAAGDSKGDLYASSAGAGEVKVYDPSHTLLASIANANEPCGLAVNSKGNLYVSEQATGKVVRYAPNKYPFEGTPTYGAPTTVDASGNARGIAVDRTDDRLYVAEGNHVAIYKSNASFEKNVLEGEFTEATGVAAYTYIYTGNIPTNLKRHYYLFVADAATDEVKAFAAKEGSALQLRRTISGVDADENPETAEDAFGFGAAGAYLAADPGNESRETRKCAQVQIEGKDQACTQGHFFLYDDASNAVDEFDATGELVDRIENAAFEDAGPTALAVERSGAAGDGTLYVSAGAGPGARLLAFRPLGMPARDPLPALSRALTKARAVAVDCQGYVYVAAEAKVRVYDPAGNELTSFDDAEGPRDLAADCAGNVYTVEVPSSSEANLTYYAPAKYPPEAGTPYTRHEPPLVSGEEGEGLQSVAVNPADEHVFAVGSQDFAPIVVEYGSAAEESPVVGECGEGLGLPSQRLDIDVYAATGEVYLTANPQFLTTVRCGGEPELLVRQIKGGGCPSGEFGANPSIAIDQSNGHIVQFEPGQPGNSAREYDSSGACVAEFGTFSENFTGYRVAVDSSCALHDPPLTEQTTPKCSSLYPSDGNAYVASDGLNNEVQPYDVSAFGPLEYPPPGKHKLTVKKPGDGPGKVTSAPTGIDCGPDCDEEYEETKVVTLTATPVGLNSKFEGWSGCEAEPSPTECKVTMSQEREVTAEFKSTSTEKFPLKVKKTGAGSGTVTSSPEGIDCGEKCEEDFGKDDPVTLTAVVGGGFEFLKWEGCDAEPSATECEVTMTGAREVTAEFDVEHPLLTVAREGNGTGSVTSSPPGIIDCGATCSAKLNLNDGVTLEAIAGEGSVFEGWEGCDAEPSATECEVTMTGGAREVTATFDALPRVIARQPLPVQYDEATLGGEIDPSGSPTEYHFEYLTQAEYEENGEAFTGAPSTPVAELPTGEEFVAVEAPLTGLEEGTEYRFRLLAENAVGAAEEEGPAFETLERPEPQECANAEYRTGLSAFLPDCRAYELVTPAGVLSTSGGLLSLGTFSSVAGSRFFNSWFVAPRGAGAGESVSYQALVTRVDNRRFRAQRAAGAHPKEGWASEPYGLTFAQGGGDYGESGGVSPDQRYSLIEVLAHETPTELAFPIGTYVRVPSGQANPDCTPEPEAFELSDPDRQFEMVGCGSVESEPGVEEVRIDPQAEGRFVSAGGAHAIFTSDEELEEGSPPAGVEAIYDREAGSAAAEVVSVKPEPDGSPFGAGEEPRYLASTEDGEAVVFSVDGDLYVHREGETMQVAAAPNTYAGIAADGRRVFFMDESFNPAEVKDVPPPAGLFACDVEGEENEGENCAGPLQDREPLEIASHSDFVNVSADGSNVFFTSGETEPSAGMELGENENGEEAEAGEANLFAWDGATTRFVAILDPQDFESFRKGPSELEQENQEDLFQWTNVIPGQLATSSGLYEAGRAYSPTRSTPGGEVLVFQSHARLTGYDNEGKGEIYRYAPAAAPGSQLACVSCDPSGAPHDSPADALFDTVVQGAINSSTMIPNVTDDGNRVFFESRQPLLPEDANEANDVYEWKALGTAGPGGDECERPGGCLALVSSGQGEEQSYFYGMSAGGEDAFFVTQEKLVGADALGSFSIYDARVLGGIPDPPVPAPCQGDACQGQGSTPPALPAPASTGPGAEGGPQGRAACAKGRHRVKGRCVKKQGGKRKRHRKHPKKQRAAHNRGAKR